MSFSLPLACRLPITAQAFETPKSLPSSTSKTSFSFTQCKPFSSSTIKPLVPYAARPRGNKEGMVTGTLLKNDVEKYKIEREVIMKEVESLQEKVQGLMSQLQEADDQKENPSAKLEGILKDSYALSRQVLELESKTNQQTTPSSSQQLFETILEQFNQAGFSMKDGLVTIDPNPNPGATSEWIDQMVRDMVDAYYHDAPPILAQIDGNFAPIRRETPPTNPLEITNGQLPADINGMYLRVGPDPVFDPEANYKWLDGDGMVHGVKIENGSATYVSRYVKNSRYLQEQVFGKAKMFKYGDMEGAYGLFVVFIQLLRQRLSVLDMSYGYTTSNVGLVYHAGRVMALEDFGKPYVLSVTENGDLVTVGMNNYGGNLNHNFTPHPKKDAVTGEMFIIGLGHVAPYATYRVVSRDGQMRNAVPITVSGPTYLHDFAITENHVIIMDNPYVFSPERMMIKDKWVFNFDISKKSRFGILPRYAADEKDIKWFEFDQPFFVFHTANAWEEDNGNKIIMYCCNLKPVYNPRTDDFDINPVAFRNFTPKHSRDGAVALTLPEMFKITFNMLTGEATMEKVPNAENASVDSPRINEDYMGRKCRFLYTFRFNGNGMATGVMKYDLESGTTSTIGFATGSDVYFSEHVFVPKQSSTAEDDGYLLCFVHYLAANTTVLFVVNAQTMTRICSIELRTRIPFGFHSIFVSKDELENQVRSLP